MGARPAARLSCRPASLAAPPAPTCGRRRAGTCARVPRARRRSDRFPCFDNSRNMEILASARWAARRGRSYAWGDRRFGEAMRRAVRRCATERAGHVERLRGLRFVRALRGGCCSAHGGDGGGAAGGGKHAFPSRGEMARPCRWRRARACATTSDDKRRHVTIRDGRRHMRRQATIGAPASGEPCPLARRAAARDHFLMKRSANRASRGTIVGRSRRVS